MRSQRYYGTNGAIRSKIDFKVEIYFYFKYLTNLLKVYVTPKTLIFFIELIEKVFIMDYDIFLLDRRFY